MMGEEEWERVPRETDWDIRERHPFWVFGSGGEL